MTKVNVPRKRPPLNPSNPALVLVVHPIPIPTPIPILPSSRSTAPAGRLLIIVGPTRQRVIYVARGHLPLSTITDLHLGLGLVKVQTAGLTLAPVRQITTPAPAWLI